MHIKSRISGYLVPVRKRLISPISASGSNFNPQNTKCIPVVKIIAFLELEKIISFSDGHYLCDPGKLPPAGVDSLFISFF
jgi:hypothetical protein